MLYCPGERVLGTIRFTPVAHESILPVKVVIVPLESINETFGVIFDPWIKIVVPRVALFKVTLYMKRGAGGTGVGVAGEHNTRIVPLQVSPGGIIFETRRVTAGPTMYDHTIPMSFSLG